MIWCVRLARLFMYRLPSWQPLKVPARGENPTGAFFFATLMAGGLVWINTYPPMTDLPQHASQVATFLRMIQGAEPWADIYRINWFTPYWFGYALTAILALWLPMTIAIKLVVSIAITATSIGAAYLRSETGGGIYWDWLFLPLGFGFAFDWGFFNFMVAVPVALWFLALTISYLRDPTLKYAGAIAIASIVLLLCHILIVLFACMIGALLAIMAAGTCKRAARFSLPFLAPAPLIFLWWLFVLCMEPQAQTATRWDISLFRVSEIVAFAAGQQNEFYSVLLALFAIGVPFAFGAAWKVDRRWYIPFLLFLLWMLFGPHEIFDNYYTYQRFGVFFLPLMVLALRPGPVIHPGECYFMPILGVVLLLPIAFRLYSFERESADYREVAANIPVGGRLLAAIVDRDSAATHLPTYLHFGAWYSANGPGLHEFSFASFVPEIIRFKENDKRPLVVWGQDWFPYNYTQTMMRGFDYLLVRKEVDHSGDSRNTGGCQLHILARSGNWTLYQNGHDSSYAFPLIPCYFWR